MEKYIIASSKKWFLKYKNLFVLNNLEIYYINSKEQLSLDNLENINPKYIFFPHWSWKIDSEIFTKYDCIVFHTAPLPFGRGGSPIQNLILRKFKKSPISALKVVEAIDSGPIYCQSEVSLDGNLDEIFKRMTCSIRKMILFICENNPKPFKQNGKPYIFKRLTYKDNELKKNFSLNELYDRIRMVDAEEYEKSYIIFGNYKIEFKNAKKKGDELNAEIRIFKIS